MRPRERLCRLGPGALSDQDLLTIILNSGIRGKSVNVLAAELLDKLDEGKDVPSMQELTGLQGLGQSKAAAIAAMLEFGRRRWGVAGRRIKVPLDIFNMIQHYADRHQEKFLCISLNGAHEVLAIRVITVGLVNRTIVHPREVYADPLQDRASAIAVAHNHPSGQIIPSKEDDEVTERLKKAGDILGIQFLEHLIFTETRFFSYKEAGKIP
jgi:DNA repair protein RadC